MKWKVGRMCNYWIGSRNERFRKALNEAFDEGSITILLADYFGQNFAAIAPVTITAGHDSRLQRLINVAKMDDWLLDLVAAAHERRPRNQALRLLAEELGLTGSGVRLINTTGSPLEALINANAKFINPQAFREKLAALEGQVCWIDTGGGGGGTGFLVGTDLVLTNWHVMKPVKEGAVSAAGVRCLFDYREPLGLPSLSAKKPVEVKLYSPEWLMDSRPPAPSDWGASIMDASPKEADYALIRLEEEIGNLPVNGAAGDPKAIKRGWICMDPATPALVAGNLLFLLQHPAGGPLRLTVGSVTQFNAAGTRLRYDAPSKIGSSGSPCFDADLQLVALHHARDPVDPPKWNQAIPFGWIRKQWDDNPAVAQLPGLKPCS
jgi:hypothetical protein